LCARSRIEAAAQDASLTTVTSLVPSGDRRSRHRARPFRGELYIRTANVVQLMNPPNWAEPLWSEASLDQYR
jgi:hypothetical protein